MKKKKRLTRNQWIELRELKELELHKLAYLKHMDYELFEAKCLVESKKYNIPTHKFKELVRCTSLYELSESLTSIEYGKRPER